MLNEEGVMSRLVAVERQILMGSLQLVPEVQRLFNRKRYSDGTKTWYLH